MGSCSQGSRGMGMRQGSLAHTVTYYRRSFSNQEREVEAGPGRPWELSMAAKLALPSLLGGTYCPVSEKEQHDG